MRKVLIAVLVLMSFEACSVAVAKAARSGLCVATLQRCLKDCSKTTGDTGFPQCAAGCNLGFDFCVNVMTNGGKDDDRTIKSNTGAGNTKNIPGAGTTAGAGTNAGAAPATTNSGVINGGNGGASSTTNGVTPAAQGSGSVQPIQQQRLKRQN